MAGQRKAKKGEMTDDEILSVLASEWDSALGEGDELEEDRARALDYMHGDPDKGYLKQDLPPSADLSKATSSDVNDAVETVLPDLMEIFTGGEDVVTLDPKSEEDEPQAEQETDYLNHVFYTKNEGWMLLYTAFKDALTSKTGILKWWWEVEEYDEERLVENVEPGTEDAVGELLAADGWERADNEEEDRLETPEGEVPGPVSLRFIKTMKRGCARIAAVPPEDFRVDPAATSIDTASWAAHKSRARIYELLEQGFDKDLVLSLPAYSLTSRTTDEEARSDLDEDESANPSYDDPTMRLVEIKEYHTWLDTDRDDKVECWRVITGNEDKVLLHMERLEDIQFESICPYPLTHRFYGKALSDLLIEVQKIKTAIMRIALNHAYFSINPRPEVSETGASQYTLSDLLKNRPGAPVRSQNGQAVRWMNPPALGTDPLALMEYMSTVGESRTGVVRNAQGLNPDTLHDTAKGAMELMGAAQRRVRMIARIFAETGLKRFFLGLHDLIVRHADKADYVRLRNGYVEVDPSKWGRRSDLTIDVGLGTNTKTYELQFWQLVLELQGQAQQLGVDMKPGHFWNAVKRLLKAGNVRNPDLFFPNPATAPEGEQQQETPPNPEIVKIQGEMRLKQEEAQMKFELEKQKLQFEAQLALYKTQLEAGLAEKAAETEARLEAMAMDRKLGIEEFKAASKAQTDTMSAAIAARTKQQQADNRISDVKLGGEIG